MSENFFDKKDFNERDGENRDGYSPDNNRPAGGGYNRREGGMRPRFSGRTEGGRTYVSSRYPSEGNRGYRPRYTRVNTESEGATGRYGENSGNYSQRSHNAYAHSEGYRPRGGYQRSENPWGKRRSYNAGADGENNNYNSEYAPRYRPAGEGGYRPRYNQGGAGREGYAQSTGGQGGYNRGGYGQRPRRSGYDPHAKYSHKKRLEYKEKNYDPNEPIRLNKYLANAGICSRRDADKYIQAGVITVNGQVVTELGTKVLRSDVVLFHDDTVKIEKKVYVLLNKPKGYVTTSEDPQNRKTVMDLVRNACPERIYPVGRLDRNTTGVLLLTNDGEMASQLTHPKFLKKKIYHVHTDQNVSAADIRQIAEGIMLEDGEIKADAIDYASPTDKKQVGIEIHSGKNRIVRRIFESLGYRVVKLDRVYFAGLTKKNVKRGDWRFLTEKEVSMLQMGAFE